MKATINRKDLIGLISDVQKVIAKGWATVPIIKTVLVQAKDGRLTLAATDLVTSIAGAIPAKVTRTGAVCVPPKSLLTFLKAIGTDNVTLSLAGKDKARVEGGRAATTISGFGYKDFPTMPTKIRGEIVTIPNLREPLGQVMYAMSTDDTRAVLTGVGMKGGEVTAADGYRLAVSKVKGQLPEAVISAEAIKVVHQLMTDKVSIGTRVKKSNNGDGSLQVQFEGSGYLLITMAVHGNFPNCELLIPKKGGFLRYDRDEMLEALKLLSISSQDEVSAILHTRGKKLRVYTVDDGDVTELIIDCKGKARAAYNVKYLSEVLARLPKGEVKQRIFDEKSPCVFTANGTRHVIMPRLILETKSAVVTPKEEI